MEKRFVEPKELNAMLRALRKVPTVTVERDNTAKTVIAHHSSGLELFRGMQWGRNNKCLWFVSYRSDLFS